MSDKPAHLCLTCGLAEWHRIANGRLHPDGRGKCKWKPLRIPTATAYCWSRYDTSSPSPILGLIEILRPITECETYEAKP